jgi:hypothetical protein
VNRAPINSGRYVPVVVNGHHQWMRGQVALQAEITELLRHQGSLTRNRIIVTPSTAQAAVEAALAALPQNRTVESSRALRVRSRLYEHWCTANGSAVARSTAASVQYNSIANFNAMQRQAAGSANK